MSENPDDYITVPEKNRPPDKIDPYDTRTGKPPRLTVDDNIYGLLNDENKQKADDAVYESMIARSGEISDNEKQYIYKQIFNQQYYESAQEQKYWNERSSMMQRLNIANTGLNAETATDADRAANMHMELAQYYEWIGTLPRNDEIFFEPEEHKDDLVDEALVKLTESGIESDDKSEERMINADRAMARGDDGLYDNMAAGSYEASQRAINDATGGNNLSGGHDDYYNP